jgi:hypothetical protein
VFINQQTPARGQLNFLWGEFTKKEKSTKKGLTKGRGGANIYRRRFKKEIEKRRNVVGERQRESKKPEIRQGKREEERSL